MDIGKNKMRGAAQAINEPDIEFENEPEVMHARIVRKHLPPAKQNGRGVKVTRRIKTQQISRKPNKTKVKCMSVVR